VIKIISEGIRSVDEAFSRPDRFAPSRVESPLRGSACVSRYFGNLAQPISLVCVITARDRALGAAARLGPQMG
jgi:hypothetical protein